MTILAFDKGVLYTDSFILIENSLDSNGATYGEKIYRDPENRFILAVNGAQPWSSDLAFHETAAKMADSIAAFEKTGKWTRTPPIKNVRSETKGYNGFLLTKKNCYRLSKGMLPKVDNTPATVGLNTGAFAYLIFAGYSTKRAMELIAKYGQGTGGTIHTYKQSSLKGF